MQADGTKAIYGLEIVMGDALIIQEPAGGTTGYLSGGTTILDGENAAAHAVIVPGEVTKFPVEVVVTTWDKDGNLISAVGGTATADKTEVTRGETITVTVEGGDEEGNAAKIEAFFKEHL